MYVPTFVPVADATFPSARATFVTSYALPSAAVATYPSTDFSVPSYVSVAVFPTIVTVSAFAVTSKLPTFNPV